MKNKKTWCVPNWLSFILFGIIFMSASAHAGSISELSSEERAAFDDAPNLFPIKKLPPIANVQIKQEPLFVNGRKLFWKSNNEIFLSVDHLDQWQAQKGEAPKLIVLNTDTGKIETTPYRGYLMCYKPERMLVCPAPTNGLPCSKMDSPRAQQYRTPFLVGTWGQLLTTMTKEMHEGLDHETCEQYPPDENIGKSVGDVKIISHLGPKHGYVGLGDWSPGSQKFALLDQAGEIYWQTELHGHCESPIKKAISWNNDYFIGDFFSAGSEASSGRCLPQYKHSAFLADPNNKAVRQIFIPNIFDGWLKQHFTGLALVWSFRGLLLFTHADYPSRQGLFWVDASGRIKRLLAERYIRTVKVSPNGCKLLLQHFAGTKNYLSASDRERRRRYARR